MEARYFSAAEKQADYHGYFDYDLPAGSKTTFVLLYMGEAQTDSEPANPPTGLLPEISGSLETYKMLLDPKIVS